ncbi:hypothetical protein [Psychrobacter lutiphocae]
MTGQLLPVEQWWFWTEAQIKDAMPLLCFAKIDALNQYWQAFR